MCVCMCAESTSGTEIGCSTGPHKPPLFLPSPTLMPARANAPPPISLLAAHGKTSIGNVEETGISSMADHIMLHSAGQNLSDEDYNEEYIYAMGGMDDLHAGSSATVTSMSTAEHSLVGDGGPNTVLSTPYASTPNSNRNTSRSNSAASSEASSPNNSSSSRFMTPFELSKWHLHSEYGTSSHSSGNSRHLHPFSGAFESGSAPFQPVPGMDRGFHQHTYLQQQQQQQSVFTREKGRMGSIAPSPGMYALSSSFSPFLYPSSSSVSSFGSLTDGPFSSSLTSDGHGMAFGQEPQQRHTPQQQQQQQQQYFENNDVSHQSATSFSMGGFHHYGYRQQHSGYYPPSSPYIGPSMRPIINQRQQRVLGSAGNVKSRASCSAPSHIVEHPHGEHPSRVLFVRNINSAVGDDEICEMFEAYGAIRSIYTACKNRGFVIISYYDIRDAKTAIKELQHKVLGRRPIDIHFSIPKENPSERDINQGTLVIFNLDASITNDDLMREFSKYGEVKEIRETPNKVCCFAFWEITGGLNEG